MTAARVSDLTAPATGAFPEGDIDLLHTMPEPRGHRDVVGPPDGQAPGIRTSVIDPGCPVGPHPDPRPAAGDGKGPAGAREAEPGHPGPRRPRKAETGMG